MFCTRCLQFCDNWVQATVASLNDNRDISWTNHRELLHNSVMELRKSSAGDCSICRSIWRYLSHRDQSSSIPLITAIFLEVVADRGFPFLKALFISSSGHEVLPTRPVALYLGEVSSSKPTDPYASHNTHPLSKVIQ